MGIASLILGIVALIFSWVPVLGWFMSIPALVGFILGIVALCSKNNKKASSIFGIIFAILASLSIVTTTILYGIGVIKMVNSEFVSTDKEDYKIGEAVNIGKTTYTVDKVEKIQGQGYKTPAPGNEFILVHLNIKNNANYLNTYSPYLFEILTNQGEFISHTEYSSINNISLFEYSRLISGGSTKVVMCFEVPKDSQGLILKIMNNIKVRIYLD